MSAVEFERAVVGSLLAGPKYARLAMEHASPADFGDARLGKIYSGICRMVGVGEQVDVVSVAAKLGDWGVRGVELSDLFVMAEAIASPASVGSAAKQVREASLRRKLTEAGQAAIEAAGTPDRPVAESIAATVQQLQAVERVDGGKFRAETLGQVLAADFSHDWLIPGLLERRERLVLTGIEGGGKSTFMRQMAILSAAGINPVTFQPMQPLKVLVVDAENSRAQWARQTQPLAERAAEEGSRDPRENVSLVCTGAMDLLKTDNLLGVHSLIDEVHPDILVIGPLYKLAPRAMNSDDDAIPLLAALDGLRMRGPALLMEAHAGKGESADGNRKMAPRGSAAFLGWPEFGFGLRPVNNTATFDLVRWRGEREQRDWPKSLNRGGYWPWIPANPLRAAA